MKHVVYLDYKSGELENLLIGKKSLLLRGAMGKKLPFGRIQLNEELYFINNNGEGLIKARGIVKKVHEYEKLSKEESIKLVCDYEKQLLLRDEVKNRFAGKRNIILIEVADVQEITPFVFNRECFGTMDDWILFQDIQEIIKQ
jgi:hypothetical protein